MIKIKPNERLLVERGINRYELVGPGLFWPSPWRRILERIDLAPQFKISPLRQVRTTENVPVDIDVQLLYRLKEESLTAELLPRLPNLLAAGLGTIVENGLGYVLRQMVADYSWRDLHQQSKQERLQRCLKQTLSSYLSFAGVEIINAYLARVDLPDALQQALIRAEREIVVMQGRADALKRYTDTLGDNLAQILPYAAQLEFLEALRQHGHLQFLITNSGLPWAEQSSDPQAEAPQFQMQLPLVLEPEP